MKGDHCFEVGMCQSGCEGYKSDWLTANGFCKYHLNPKPILRYPNAVGERKILAAIIRYVKDRIEYMRTDDIEEH